MRIKKREKITIEPSTLDVLVALTDVPEWLSFLSGKGHDYDDLLPALKDLAVEDDNRRLSVKSLSEEIGFKPAKNHEMDSQDI